MRLATPGRLPRICGHSIRRKRAIWVKKHEVIRFLPSKQHCAVAKSARRPQEQGRFYEAGNDTLAKPYQVRFCMRASYDPWFVGQVRALKGVRLEREDRCFAYATSSAEDVGDLLNRIEWIVLKP